MGTQRTRLADGVSCGAGLWMMPGIASDLSYVSTGCAVCGQYYDGRYAPDQECVYGQIDGNWGCKNRGAGLSYPAVRGQVQDPDESCIEQFYSPAPTPRPSAWPTAAPGDPTARPIPAPTPRPSAEPSAEPTPDLSAEATAEPTPSTTFIAISSDRYMALPNGVTRNNNLLS